MTRHVFRDANIKAGPVPADVLAYFRAKKLKPGFDYRDTWEKEHSTAFAVAKVMRLDVLEALQSELDRAVEQGVPFKQWAKDIKPRMETLGWWAPHEVADPQTGKTAKVNPPQRLRTIYETNLRTSRAAAQWERIQRTKKSRPFLLYQVGPSERHRPEHLAWHGLLLPVDDTFWETHYPPCGYGCKCFVRSVSNREADELERDGILGPQPEPELDDNGNPTGHVVDQRIPVKREAPPVELVPWENKRTGKVEFVPRGIDPGFAHRPGEGRAKYLEERGEPIKRVRKHVPETHVPNPTDDYVPEPASPGIKEAEVSAPLRLGSRAEIEVYDLRQKSAAHFDANGMKLGQRGERDGPLAVDSAIESLGLRKAASDWSGESAGAICWYQSSMGPKAEFAKWLHREATDDELQAASLQLDYRGDSKDLQKLARAQYAATQEVLFRRRKDGSLDQHVDARGFVTLYRGISGDQAKAVRSALSEVNAASVPKGEPREVTLPMRSLSSWTTSREIADFFASDGHGVIIKQTVHISRVYSHWQNQEVSTSRYGREQEWILAYPEERATFNAEDLETVGDKK